jgi:hypothetical protein
VNAILLDPPLKAGEEYSVKSLLGRPTVVSMRAAGVDYPDYIKERYCTAA